MDQFFQSSDLGVIGAELELALFGMIVLVFDLLVKNKLERKDFVYVGKVGTGFNRKSSMEIRKKLDAILSSKSRLAKAPRLKGATWVLRADR